MDSTHFLQIAFALIVTYGMHSTLLLSAAWLADRRKWISSNSLREKIWKCAAISPLLTATIQVSWTDAVPVWEIEFGNQNDTSVIVETSPTVPSDSQISDGPRKLAESPDRPKEKTNLDKTISITTSTDAPSSIVIAAAPPIEKVNSSPEETGSIPKSEAVDHSRNDEWTVTITPGTTHPSTTQVAERISTGTVARKTSQQPHRSSDVFVQNAPAELVDAAHRMNTDDSPNRRPPNAGPVASTKMIPSEPNTIGDREARVGYSDRTQLPSAASTAPVKRKPKEIPRTAILIVCVIALSGLIGSLKLLVATLRIALLKRSCGEAQQRTRNLLQAIVQGRAINQPVSLLSSRHVGEPSALGVFRWAIVLPEGLEEKLSDDELAALLCHELGHLVRRDTVWLWFGRILTHAIPWQPLNFFAVQRWNQAAEFQCDDWAVRDTSSRIVLARVLANVAELKLRKTFSPGVPVSAPPLSLRIERLLSEKQSRDRWLTRRRKALLATGMLVAVSVMACCAPRLIWAESSNATRPTATMATTELERSSAAADKSLILLKEDIAAMVEDLELALQLLNEHEQDEEVVQRTHAILKRLDELRATDSQTPAPDRLSNP